MSELGERTAELRALRNTMIEDAVSLVELADDFATIGGSIIDGISNIPDSYDPDDLIGEIKFLNAHAVETRALADGYRTARDSLDAFFINQDFDEALRARVRAEFEPKIKVLDHLASSFELLVSIAQHGIDGGHEEPTSILFVILGDED